MEKWIWSAFIVFVLGNLKNMVFETPAGVHQAIADTTVHKIQATGIYHMINIYPVGDVNGDQQKDTAFINYDIKVDANSTFLLYDCDFRDCLITMRFGHGIPDLSIRSHGVYVLPLRDLNRDAANEIILYNRWELGGWKDISVYSLQKKQWKELAHGKSFGELEEDFSDRVIKEGSKYYLLGDKWEDAQLRMRMDTIPISH